MITVCDFGLASILEDGTRALSVQTTTSGTVRWMAPELFAADHAPHTSWSDIWAYGCLVLEVQYDHLRR